MVNIQANLFLQFYVVIMSSCPLSTVAGHTFLSEQKGFECGHGKLGNHVPRFSQTQEQVQKLTTNTYEAMDGAERYKRRVFQSIRIHTHYDVSVWKLKLPFLKVVRWVIPAAVSYFQNVLKVHRRIEPINIPRDCSDKAIAKDNETGQAYCQYSCVQKPQCYNMPIPVEHAAACYEKGGMFKRPGLAYLAGPGVLEADYVLYIYSQLTDQCLFGDVLAYATCCLQDEQNFRPIAGMMNICPQHLGLSQDSVSNILATVQHEIIHALGFSSSLYPYYLNEAGKPWVTIDPETGLPPIDVYGDFVVSKKVLKSVFSRQWKVAGGNISRQTKYIVTPRVQEEVRRHFNCGSLEGAPLEDQGVQSSWNSHWEKRVFMNEIMTASVAFGTYVISRLTLALLEDTGWYLTDGNKAGDLLWGRSLGCDFVTQSCFEWIHTRMKKHHSVRPYCHSLPHKLLDTGCTENHEALTFCAISRYDRDLPQRYQNFLQLSGVPSSDVHKYGGMNKYADYCPTNEVFMMRRSDERITSTHCRYESNFVDQRRNVALETYGNESKCFEQFGMWIAENPTGVIHASRTGSGCYRYKCNPVDDTYAILVTTQRFQCTYSWQVIKMKVKTHSWTHHGTLMCPPYSIICQMKTLPSVYHLHQLTPEDNNRHREVIFMSSAQVSAPDFFCCVVGIIILVVDLDIQ